MDTVNDIKVRMPMESVLPCATTVDVRKDVAILTHEDCRVLGVARYADAPYRNAGLVSLLTLGDFRAYVLERQAAISERPLILVNKAQVQAVFNSAGWQDDAAVFAVEFTPEWRAWNANNEHSLSQENFCDFLEDHLPEIVSPCGAELLEMVANFRQMTRVEYGSSYRGSDGQIMLEYKENKVGAGGKDMALPAEFILHLPVVRGAEQMTTYEVKARLRVRVDSDSHRLTLQYTLVRPDVPRDNAIADIAGHLREVLPDARVYAGAIVKSPGDLLG